MTCIIFNCKYKIFYKNNILVSLLTYLHKFCYKTLNYGALKMKKILIGKLMIVSNPSGCKT